MSEKQEMIKLLKDYILKLERFGQTEMVKDYQAELERLEEEVKNEAS